MTDESQPMDHHQKTALLAIAFRDHLTEMRDQGKDFYRTCEAIWAQDDQPKAVCMECGEEDAVCDFLPRVDHATGATMYQCLRCGHWNRPEPAPKE
jgi:hypothetical protein